MLRRLRQRLAARRGTSRGVPLAPVTLGRYLAVRALAYPRIWGRDEAGQEVERWGETLALDELPDAQLDDLLSVLTDGAAPRMQGRQARLHYAARFLEAFEQEAARQTALGMDRAREVVHYTNFGWSTGDGGPEPLEAAVCHLSMAEYAAVRDLPLWEAVMHGGGASSVANFQAFQRATNNRSGVLN